LVIGPLIILSNQWVVKISGPRHFFVAQKKRCADNNLGPVWPGPLSCLLKSCLKWPKT